MSVKVLKKNGDIKKKKRSWRYKMLGDADLRRRISTNKNIGEYYICFLKYTYEKRKKLSVTSSFFHPDDVVKLMKSLS